MTGEVTLGQELDERQADEQADEREAVVGLEHELSVLLRRARALSKDFAHEVHPGLEADAYGLLIRIADSDGARGTDLAAYFGIGKPTISRQVRLLEELGLVRRSGDPDDARAAVLSLTDEGRTRLTRMREARRERYAHLLAAWPAGDIRQLAVLLGRFNALF